MCTNGQVFDNIAGTHGGGIYVLGDNTVILNSAVIPKLFAIIGARVAMLW